jgi:hypothetical protein
MHVNFVLVPNNYYIQGFFSLLCFLVASIP